jgi:hypothetical protein
MHIWKYVSHCNLSPSVEDIHVTSWMMCEPAKAIILPRAFRLGNTFRATHSVVRVPLDNGS